MNNIDTYFHILLGYENAFNALMAKKRKKVFLEFDVFSDFIIINLKINDELHTKKIFDEDLTLERVDVFIKEEMAKEEARKVFYRYIAKVTYNYNNLKPEIIHKKEGV